MHNDILKQSIISGYTSTMDPYLSGPLHQQAIWEANKMYFQFRNQLPEDMQKEFDDIINAYDEISEKTAEEAFYRGSIAGIACRDDVVK